MRQGLTRFWDYCLFSTFGYTFFVFEWANRHFIPPIGYFTFIIIHSSFKTLNSPFKLSFINIFYKWVIPAKKGVNLYFLFSWMGKQSIFNFIVIIVKLTSGFKFYRIPVNIHKAIEYLCDLKKQRKIYWFF